MESRGGVMNKDTALLINEERNPEECQTAPICAEYSLCLKKEPQCKFAIAFGGVYVCKHPNHLNFIKICRTPPEV